MTEKESFADKVRDHATDEDSPYAHQAPDRRRWTDILMHRWPTALGIAVAALAAFDLEDALEFAALTVLMALVYLGAAALDRRWSAWVVLLAGLLPTFFIPSNSGLILRWSFSSPHPSSWSWEWPVGNGKDPVASGFRPSGYSPSVRPRW